MAAVARKHHCARCGKAVDDTSSVFSSHSRRWYCADLKACAKRAGKRPQPKTFNELKHQ